MVRFELERHLPYAGEDTPFDFVPLEADGTGRSVLIAAADRRVVDGALRVMEEAKLRPLSITVASHNLLALVARPRRGHVVWIHRAGGTTDLLFIDGPTLVFSRGVADGGDDVVVDEIRRSLSVTRWQGCDAIWVSGDAAPDPTGPLAALGVPVEEPPYTPTARRRLAEITEGPRGLLELALAVASGPRIRPLELLPPALRPKHLTRTQMVGAGLAALTLLLAILALLVPGWRESRRLANVNARIAQLDTEVRAVEKVMQELDRKRRLLTTIQSIETASVRPLPVLRELTELLPTDSWLTMLSLDTKGAELTGQAGAAATLIPLLENSPRLERVEFSSPVTRGRDREQFRIRAAWEGGAPGAAPAVVSAPVPQPAVPPGAVPGQSRAAPGQPARQPAPNLLPPVPQPGAATPPPVPQPGVATPAPVTSPAVPAVPVVPPVPPAPPTAATAPVSPQGGG